MTKAACWAVLSIDQLHCDGVGGGEAHFGGGTKLIVLGKKSYKKNIVIEVFLEDAYKPQVYFKFYSVHFVVKL